MKLQLSLTNFLPAIGLATLLALTCLPCAAVEGIKLYRVQCATCHGALGAGNAKLQAPPLAGIDSDYAIRQLNNFRVRARGGDAAQDAVASMQAIAMSIPDEASVLALGHYIGSLKQISLKKNPPPSATVLNTGKAVYSVCMACHGSHAEGIPILRAPRLNHLPPWYVTRQLQAYLNGQRGAHPADVAGKQMQLIVNELQLDDESMRSVSIYISSLQGQVKR